MRIIDTVPKVIWTLWFQGWDKAPKVALSCLSSWKRLNPDYVVHALDEKDLKKFIPEIALSFILSTSKELEAISDQIRIELLSRYGGVWVDATAMCAKPLSTWLPGCMSGGFFAFEKPSNDRELSSWFLASTKSGYIVNRWRQSTYEYWNGRTQRHSYFWFHELFLELCNEEYFKNKWDSVSKLPALNKFHFGPESEALKNRAEKYYQDGLLDPPVPVFKLTHKIELNDLGQSLFNNFLDFGFYKKRNFSTKIHPIKKRSKILVSWYGSFEGHGTIGDLKSMECLVTHLVGQGNMVAHSSAAAIDITGSQKVDWMTEDPTDWDVVIFCCGPILRTHELTSALFKKFKGNHLIGVGVSILDKENFEYLNPFSAVFARQGQNYLYGDLAVAVPQRNFSTHKTPKKYIGVVLRGLQSEYGIDNCKSDAAQALIYSFASKLANQYSLEIIYIENHLARSGITQSEIEALYDNCCLIITTRFHGGVMAMLHDIPFIAIDQIVSGGKVYELLAKSGWAYLYQIYTTTLDILNSDVKKALSTDSIDSLKSSREVLVNEANRTLCALDAHLNTLN